MWYLGERLVGLAIFDLDVSTTVKRKMFEALEKSPDYDINLKKYVVTRKKNVALSVTGISGSRASRTFCPLIRELKKVPVSLDGFVSKRTQSFFEISSISQEFLQCEPPKNGQKTRRTQLRCQMSSRHFGVALAQQYEDKITKD